MWVLIVCAESAHHSFLPPTPNIYSLKPAPLQRPLSQRLVKLVYLIQLYTVILTLCLFVITLLRFSAVCNNSTAFQLDIIDTLNFWVPVTSPLESPAHLPEPSFSVSLCLSFFFFSFSRHPPIWPVPSCCVRIWPAVAKNTKRVPTLNSRERSMKENSESKKRK